MARHDPDRLLVTNGFRHFRRTYSLTEVKWGFLVLATLVVITVWIGWRGTLRPPELYGAVELSGQSSTDETAAAIVPTPLVDESWRERERSEFDTKNLYEKINGRADFFTSKGFERLYFVSLEKEETPAISIDLELYDMGSASGALTAFTAERQEGADVIESKGGQHYSSRNAMFMVQGKFYGRALGVDESPMTLAALATLRGTLEQALVSSDRSWALALLVDQLGFEPNTISFAAERAFSLEAADKIWIVGIEDDAELFISVRKSKEAAEERAAAIATGFASYGKASESEPDFIVDEFLGAVSTSTSSGEFVIGVRAAPSVEVAKAGLEKMRAAIADMSPVLRESARKEALDASTGTPGGTDASEPSEKPSPEPSESEEESY